MDVGNDHVGRADDVTIHLRLREDGNVLIEYDGIEYGIAQDLLEAGIAPEDILFNMYATPRPLKEAIAT
jgi:XisI protein